MTRRDWILAWAVGLCAFCRLYESGGPPRRGRSARGGRGEAGEAAVALS